MTTLKSLAGAVGPETGSARDGMVEEQGKGSRKAGRVLKEEKEKKRGTYGASTAKYGHRPILPPTENFKGGKKRAWQVSIKRQKGRKGTLQAADEKDAKVKGWENGGRGGLFLLSAFSSALGFWVDEKLEVGTQGGGDTPFFTAEMT